MAYVAWPEARPPELPRPRGRNPQTLPPGGAAGQEVLGWTLPGKPVAFNITGYFRV